MRFLCFFFLMIRRPPRATRTDTLFPYTTLFRSHVHGQMKVPNGMLGVLQIGDVALPRGRTIRGVENPADLQIAQELPMVLNDAGTIARSLHGQSFPATAPITGKQGDWILVNSANEVPQVNTRTQQQFHSHERSVQTAC